MRSTTPSHTHSQRLAVSTHLPTFPSMQVFRSLLRSNSPLKHVCQALQSEPKTCFAESIRQDTVSTGRLSRLKSYHSPIPLLSLWLQQPNRHSLLSPPTQRDFTVTRPRTSRTCPCLHSLLVRRRGSMASYNLARVRVTGGGTSQFPARRRVSSRPGSATARFATILRKAVAHKISDGT